MSAIHQSGQRQRRGAELKVSAVNPAFEDCLRIVAAEDNRGSAGGRGTGRCRGDCGLRLEPDLIGPLGYVVCRVLVALGLNEVLDVNSGRVAPARNQTETQARQNRVGLQGI